MGPGVLALFVIATTYGAETVEHKPLTAKPFLAGMSLGLILTLIYGISPRVGTAASILVGTTAAVVNGQAILTALANVNSPALTSGTTALAPGAGTDSGGGNWAPGTALHTTPVRVSPPIVSA